MRKFFLLVMFAVTASVMMWALSPGDGVPDKAGGADIALVNQADLDLQAGILKRGDCGVPDTPDQDFVNISNKIAENRSADSFKKDAVPIVQSWARYPPWCVQPIYEVLRT